MLFGSMQGKVGNECSFWGSASDPRHTSISAIIGVFRLVPASMHATEPCLFVNPYATHPVKPGFLGLQARYIDPQSGAIRSMEGERIRELLALPEHWPLSWLRDMDT